MLKLPICPYCGREYNYSTVKKLKHKKEFVCAKCKKKMAVTYIKHAALWGILSFFIILAIDTLFLIFTSSQTIYPNVFLTIALIIVYLILTPLMVQFHKMDGQENSDGVKRKKNRRRHAKTSKEKYPLPNIEKDPLRDTGFDESSD